MTAFNRLRDDVGKLGSGADTLDLRRRIGQSSDKFRELAMEFKQKAAKHPDKSSTAAQKLLRDFQVRDGASGCCAVGGWGCCCGGMYARSCLQSVVLGHGVAVKMAA